MDDFDFYIFQLFFSQTKEAIISIFRQFFSTCVPAQGQCESHEYGESFFGTMNKVRLSGPIYRVRHYIGHTTPNNPFFWSHKTLTCLFCKVHLTRFGVSICYSSLTTSIVSSTVPRISSHTSPPVSSHRPHTPENQAHRLPANM